MRLVLIVLASFIFMQCGQESTAKHEKDNTILGYYRLRGGGGYGVILKLKDSTSIDYLQWVDVGGFYNGNDGQYDIKGDTLIIKVFYPIDRDSHYLRIDTLRIERWGKIPVFIPKFIDNEWIVDYDPKDERIIAGSDCFAKVAELNENYISDLDITWRHLNNKNSVPIKLPSVDKILKDLKINKLE